MNTSPTLDLVALAERLTAARLSGSPTPQLTIDQPGLSLDDAYRVQAAGVAERLDAGEHISGVKLGLTSKAKAEQMGVKDVIIGVVTDAMVVADGGVLDIAAGVHPRVEPEIAFRIRGDINPSDPPEDLRSVVDAVAPALEIIDSRYENFSFTLPDVVADNTSASHYVIGPWRELLPGETFRLADRFVELSIDDELVEAGSTTAILGDPWQAVTDTIRMAAQYGHSLPADGVLLAGAATAAVGLTPGTTVSVVVEDLGAVSVAIAPIGSQEECR